eukprot:TRINITY_DN535_c0_g1_i1.p3 TRINITY_DN535_c0_g1~~TRINITY_DN535_c0_g1_i1.p3  ORF type:complete len:118 (+),score=8.38 TRINITY_DN535_c0_g1_i1:210-563(+)
MASRNWTRLSNIVPSLEVPVMSPSHLAFVDCDVVEPYLSIDGGAARIPSGRASSSLIVMWSSHIFPSTGERFVRSVRASSSLIVMWSSHIFPSTGERFVRSVRASSSLIYRPQRGMA